MINQSFLLERNSYIQLTPLGLLAISGEGAKKFLQGQLTCDINEINSTHHSLGAHCNPQGRMISLFRIFFFQEKYYLQMPRDCIDIATKALAKYAVFFKVDLTDESETLSCLGIAGPNVHEILISTVAQDYSNEAITTPHFIIMKLPGIVPRYEIIGEKTALTTLQQQLSANLTTAEFDTWKYLDITAGIPQVYATTSEKFLPHDVNLPQLNGVSFKKGCFTGQEIIARMQYLGKLKKHLCHVTCESDTPPFPGDEKNPNGIIVDCVEVGYNNYELLVIADKANKNG